MSGNSLRLTAVDDALRRPVVAAAFNRHNLRKICGDCMTYIHERAEWPALSWDAAKLLPLVTALRHQQGRLLGRMEEMGFALRAEASLATLTSDVLKSSAIEGEVLDAAQVRSSIARHLGMEVAGIIPASRAVEGVVEMMLDATQQFRQPLHKERLYAWHAALLPTGRSGMRKITVGAWRKPENDPMQVVSGPIGRERIHFAAPAAAKLDAEQTVSKLTT